MREVRLPEWAKIIERGGEKLCAVIEVDSDSAYEAWLTELLPEATTPDQYWIEAAYQCIKMDVQAAIEGTDLDPSLAGKSAQINLTPSDRWALKNFKKGKGVNAATQGREARDHYKRIRGRIPFSA